MFLQIILRQPLFAQYHFQPGLYHPAGFVAHAGAGGQGQDPIPDARGDLCLDDGLFRRVLQKLLPGLPLAEALTVGGGIQRGPIGRENIEAEDAAVHQQVAMGDALPNSFAGCSCAETRTWRRSRFCCIPTPVEK